MIERVYLDNIRSFVNFEWKPGPMAVLLGANGSGKTNLLRTLAEVQRFIEGDRSAEEAFPATSRTRWDIRPEQVVELDLRTSAGVFRYRLVIEHSPRKQDRARVREETVRLGDTTLIEFSLGLLTLFRDDGTTGVRVRARMARSGVGFMNPDPDSHLLALFKKAVNDLWFMWPDPRAITARLQSSSVDWLEPDLSNFADWYLQILTEKPGSVFKAISALGDVLNGIVELHAVSGWLNVRYELDGRSLSFRLDELSDGQRALIALYVLRHTVAVPGHLLALDEPDNYVGLSEIQPYLIQLERAALKTDGPQIWIVSHHPEVLNLLALEHGWRFFRDGEGPTRVERFQPIGDLAPAEAVARGWTE